MIQEHLIRQRAHSIWESEGRPSGRADAHWALASAQLTSETTRETKKRPALKKAAAAAAPEPRVKGKATTRKSGKPATTA